MSNVQVAIRVRPLNARETTDGRRIAVQVEDKIVRIRNVKLEGRPDGHVDSREKVTEFGFDYCYWSVDPDDPNCASQEEVFQDLGVSVLTGASEGYNVCLFAYGQTGSGKTYTMMGTPASVGLTPRICQGLFGTDDSSAETQGSSRVEISFLQIYNERVRDLLKPSEQKKPPHLRVREHPEKGPYVQGLSQYVVTDYKQAVDLLEAGIANRITAATHVHDASSRSHAIFTIQYTQAILENNLPSEIVSKINLVDLAGSERADPHYCRDRITEGSNINKSLVTLGIVISALAQNSQMCNSCQSINSVVSEGEGSTVGSQSSGHSAGPRRQCFIPYRDSVLTWLLKDSLGGNSKTIMIATVSPSCSSYNETLSTLRYAAHARNIVNKPRVNEDANVQLIRELREEIDRLKSMLLSFKMRNPSPALSEDRDGNLSDIILQNELKVEQLTKDWSESWQDKKELLEQYSVDIDRDRAGFLIRSLLPHLIALDRDVLSTGVTFYHLREGVTKIGPQDAQYEPQIVLQGEARCEIVNQRGVVTLKPAPGSVCIMNGREVTEPCRLAQGAVITLGEIHKFRFNHPEEAAILRERRRVNEGELTCGSADLSFLTPEHRVEGEGFWERGGARKGTVPRQRVEEQQRYVETLRDEIQVEQQEAEQELEREQADLRQRHRDIQQWVLQEKQRLSAKEARATGESGVQTDPHPVTRPQCLALGFSRGGMGDAAVGDRKRVVQEELLRHHALRRAESRVRRKRLHYQLQRVARKRHLLEAKGELQRLESALSPDSPTSSETDSPLSTAGASSFLRRHSFSADLLLRLYPNRAPTFSNFLRRNRSLEFSSSWRTAGPQRWTSDECLPSRRMRGRANTLPSGSRGFEVHANSLEHMSAGAARVTGEMAEEILSNNRATLNRRKKDEAQNMGSSERNGTDVVKMVPSVGKPSTTCSSPKRSKPSPRSSKGLERLRKVFSPSAGPAFRTALSKLFRKPPSGPGPRGSASNSKTAAKSGNKTEDRRVLLYAQTEKRPLKVALSCDNLEQNAFSEEAEPKSWHSKGALARGGTVQPALLGWTENRRGKDGEGSSDGESSFSVDSLSSAYAAALTEQLRREESDCSSNDSEAGSVDSQISQDSLAAESNSKESTARPKSKQPLSSSFCAQAKWKKLLAEDNGAGAFSHCGSLTSDEMPAEVYWRRQSSSSPKQANKPATKWQLVREMQMEREANTQTELKVAEEPEEFPLPERSRPFSCPSVRESESLLVLTDAWSSTEPSDSPRMHSKPSVVGQLTQSHAVHSISSLQSSVELSGDSSESENKPFYIGDSTGRGDATLTQKKYWDTEMSTDDDSSMAGMLGDKGDTVVETMDTRTMVKSMNCQVWREGSEIGTGVEDAQETIKLEEPDMKMDDNVKESVSSGTENCTGPSFPAMEYVTLNNAQPLHTDKSSKQFDEGDCVSLSTISDLDCPGENTCWSSNEESMNTDGAVQKEQPVLKGSQVDDDVVPLQYQPLNITHCDTDTHGDATRTADAMRSKSLLPKEQDKDLQKPDIGLNEDSAPIPGEMSCSGIVKQNLLEKLGIKHSDRSNYLFQRNIVEEVEGTGKEGRILPLCFQDSEDMLEENQGTCQASLRTQTDFKSKHHDVSCEVQRETLEMKNLAVPKLEEDDIEVNFGSFMGDIATDLYQSELNLQTDAEGMREECYSRGAKVNSVKKVCKRFDQKVNYLKCNVNQKASYVTVGRSAKCLHGRELYRGKRKYKLRFAYTKSKNLQKNKADKKVEVPTSSTENPEIRECFSKELPICVTLHGHEGAFTLEKEEKSSKENPASSLILVSEPSNDVKSTVQQMHKHFAGMETINKSILNSSLNMCKTFVSPGSVDVLLVEKAGDLPSQTRENVDLNQKSTIQEENGGLLEYLSPNGTKETAQSPVDQKITEVVKEHMKLNPRECEETSSNDELNCKEITTELSIYKYKNISLHEGPVTSRGLESTGNKMKTLNSKNKAGLEEQNLMSDVTQNNSSSEAGQTILGREMGIVSFENMNSVQVGNDDDLNSVASLDTKEHESSGMVTIDILQEILESKKKNQNHTKLSNDVICSEDVIIVVKNQSVKNVDVMDCSSHQEIEMKAATAEHQLLPLNTCEIGSAYLIRSEQIKLETVDKPGAERNNEVHGTRSTPCQFQSCKECDFSKQVHLSDRVVQTELNNVENIYISTEGSSISQVREDKRHDPVPHEGDASSENWRGAHLKVSRSTSDDSGSEDLGVLTRSRGQAFRPNASPSNGNPSLSTSVKITEPKMNVINTHENVSRDVDPDNVNTIISQECNLNSFRMQSEQFLQNVTLDHSWPFNDVDLVNKMCQDQCTDEAKFALGKDRSAEENKFCHLSSFTHLTETSKQGQTTGPLTNSGKKGVERPLQKGPLKSETSTENSRKTYKVSSDPSVLQNDNEVQIGSLQMCAEGDSTQCNVCVEGCSDGKTPSDIVPTGAINDCNNKDLIELDVALNAEIAHNSLKGMSVAEKAIMISSTFEKHPEMDFLTDGVSQALTETSRTSASSVVNIRSEKDHCDAAKSRKWDGHRGSRNAVCNSLHPTKETVDSFDCQTGQSLNGFSATTCVKPRDTKHYLGERDHSKSNSAVVLQGTAKTNKALSLSSPLQTFQHSHVSCAHTTSCSFTDTLNSAVSPQKIKPKRLKRSNAKASPTSTSDSAVDSSPEEVISKVHPARSILKQSRVRANIQHKQEAAVTSSGAGFSDVRHKSLTTSPVSMSSTKDTDSLKHFRGTLNKTSGPLCTETNCNNDNKTRGEGKCVQQESNTTNHLKEKVQVLESDNCAQAGILNEAHSYAPKQLQQHAATPAEQVVPLVSNQQNLGKNDSTMHFASSDINPFVHPWQDVSSREKYKQAFGSATDISCKSDSGSNHVIRCCSVDDGLNVTNSPFHAHLSALACNKNLSSTLSSIEGYKEQASSECQYPSSHSQGEHSYCSGISGDQCNGSGQVDEIMLVCSSEQESSAAIHKNCYTLNCNHSTQTNVEGRQKKKRLHRRNKTQVERTEDSEVPTMWRSLQNMSLHLSQLLHNTSGFLGNIGCIEAKKTDNYAINNDVSPSFNCSKRDSSTQTSVDIAVQTDRNTKLLSNTNTLPGCLEGTTEEALKPPEVNVIVKVIGTDMLSMSQEKCDMTLTLQDRILSKNPSQKMLSMPDLHVGSHPKKSQSSTETVPLRAQSSASSPETDKCKYSHFRSDTSLVFPSSHTAEPAFSSGLAVTRTNNNSLQTPKLKNLTLRKGDTCHHSAKDVYYVDRASSPILTVEAGAATQMVKNKSSQCLLDCQNTEFKPVKDLLWKKRNSQTASTYRFQAKKQERFPFEKTKMSEQGHQHIDQLGEVYGDRATRFSFDNVSKLSHSYSEESEGYTVNSVPFKRRTFNSNTGERVKGQMVHIGFSDADSPTMKSNIQSPRLCYMHSSTKDQHHSSLISRYQSGSPPLDCRQEENTSRTSTETFILDKDLSFNNQSLENYYRETNDMRRCFSSPESFEISEGTLQLQEDDAMSLAPSECNTDILVNIKPSVEQTETEHQRVPDDLPMHNKFTSWSGVGYQPPSSMSSGLAHLPSSAQNTKNCRPGQDRSEGTKEESTILSSNRLKEIERLRQEREQVLAAVRLDMNHQQLTVELTEAKLHYGQGETDAMLKMLKSGSVEDPNGVPSKQELYDRHKRSIESLRQEREAQLQTCRRARSLSPSKHGASPGKGPALPVRATELPSQRRDYLQKLRQAVVSNTRVTTPLRLTGERPSEIELLLQDYGRAREEARTEIARVRDRLRERAEQEKRRLQQQVLSQLVKNDLRLRTRASSSTLCTGSSLSLSSGPTSGYNSSNTVLLKEGNSPSEAPQCLSSGVLEVRAPKVRGHSPVRASHRPWLSAQDVRVEATVHRSDPLDPSSSAPQGRQRTLSLSSTSSMSKSYQDIAASALASATAEMYSAAGGDLENLLLGRASGAWRYHGAERGVRAYHKPSSSPSVHGFLGAAELERPLHSLWCMVRDHSKAHLYNGSVRSAWTRPVDGNLQLAYLLTDTSSCHLCQPLDFCCISAESRQEGQWTLAVRSVQEDSLPPPGAEVVRGELLPSAWLLQPRQREGRDVVWVFYLLQVDLRTPAHSQRLLNSITRQHAAVIAELDAFFSL